MADQDIAEIFDAVARDIEPDLPVLIREATRRGHELRARHRLTVALSAGVSVVAVALAVIFGASLLAPAHGTAPVTGASQSPQVSHVVRTPVAQEHGPGMTEYQMLSLFKRTLRSARAITWVGLGQERGYLVTNVNDGKGNSDVEVYVQPTTTYWKNSVRCPKPPLKDIVKRQPGAPPESCKTITLADGGVEQDMVTRTVGGSNLRNQKEGFYDYQVTLNRPDGVTVLVEAGNGTLSGTFAFIKHSFPYVDRVRPPGSMTFWRAMAENPAWHL